jgi:GTPase
MTSAPESRFRSGFVSILGRPNAGKSTLLNALVGEKLAIISEKPQTTRTSIQGVVNLPGAQIVLLDTPGIHASGTLFDQRMMETIRAALGERDVILYLGDATAPFGAEDLRALETIGNLSTPTLLVLTKIDRLSDKRLLLPRIEQYKAVREFAEYIPISAVTGEGLDTLRAAMVARLPAGPAYFPPDYVTEQPERFMAAELIREQILRETRQEVPHSTAITVDRWDQSPRLTRISATIYVERPGQKAILIGAGGATLKKVGTRARQQIEALLARKVFLELFVKVRKDWRENPEFLNAIDWRSMRGGELDSEPNPE